MPHQPFTDPRNPTYTDGIHQPIAVGDTVIYPTRQGSSTIAMTTARIVEIVPIVPRSPDNLLDYEGATDDDAKKGRTRRIKRRYVRPDGQRLGDGVRDDTKAYTLRVERIQEGYDGYYTTDTHKRVTILAVENVVKVEL